MFGHQNDVSSGNTNSQVASTILDKAASADGSVGSTATMGTMASGTSPTVTTMTSPTEPSSAPMVSEPTSNDYSAPTVVEPTDTPADTSITTPADENSEPIIETPAISTGDTTTSPSIGGSNDLLNLKQQALQQLSPLIGHLDQSPEEKFRTTMMMIQANDDQSLIKSAYAAAQEITDEKVRAQALLDVVNEINYFTQKKS